MGEIISNEDKNKIQIKNGKTEIAINEEAISISSTEIDISGLVIFE